MQPLIEAPKLTAEGIANLTTKRETVSLKLRELNTTLKDKVKNAILVEQFVRFFELDLDHARKTKTESAKLNAIEGKPVVQHQHALEHFIHLTENCYYVKTFYNQIKSSAYTDSIAEAYKNFNFVYSEIIKISHRLKIIL